MADSSPEKNGEECQNSASVDEVSSESLGLPPTCTVIEKSGEREVYVVGTAHFSRESQEDVSVVMRKIQPHVVFLELCRSRIGILDLTEERLLEEVKQIGYEKLRSSIRQNGAVAGIMQVLMLLLNAKMTEKLGMTPGGEFRRAFQEALKIPHCRVVHGDRPISITIQRAIGSLSWYQKLQFGWKTLFSDLDLSVEDIEKCKDKDILEAMLAEMSDEFPSLKEVFLDERDIYLAHSLRRSSNIKLGPEGEYTKPIKVVAVLGLGHVSGVVKYWNQDLEKRAKEVLQLPQPTVAGRVFKLCAKTAVLAGTVYVGYLASRGTFRLINRLIS